MKTLRRGLLLALFAAVFVAIWQFTARNADTVTVDLLVGEIPGVRLWMALIGAFAAGAASAAAGLVFQLAKKSLLARRYRKTMEGLESEIHQLRNLPLAGAGEPPAGEERLARTPRAGA